MVFIPGQQETQVSEAKYREARILEGTHSRGAVGTARELYSKLCILRAIGATEGCRARDEGLERSVWRTS